MDHEFFNELGKEMELVVFSFGEYPKFHKEWHISKFQENAKYYSLKRIGKNTNSKKNHINIKGFIALIREKPDVVISIAFWMPSIYSAFLKRILRYKFVIISDSIYETEKNISIFKKFIRRIILNKTNFVLSSSKLTTKYIRSLNSKTNIVESSLVIDANGWRSNLSALPSKVKVREDLGLDSKIDILLGVGNFSAKKNWEVVLNVIHEIPNCLFILIGYGSKKEDYLKYINQQNLQDNVLVIDSIDRRELIKYYKASDIFIFPSLFDQFGYVVIEALYSGLPVLCSKNTGASMLIKNGYNGYLVNPNKNIKKQIKLAIKNNKLLSANCLESIKNYNLDNKVKEYLNAFKN